MSRFRTCIHVKIYKKKRNMKTATILRIIWHNIGRLVVGILFLLKTFFFDVSFFFAINISRLCVWTFVCLHIHITLWYLSGMPTILYYYVEWISIEKNFFGFLYLFGCSSVRLVYWGKKRKSVYLLMNSYRFVCFSNVWISYFRVESRFLYTSA